jgi:hypothetical protein
MLRSQPQGQRIPTHQSSSPSRANTRSRRGRRAGKLSPAMMRNFRRGATRAHVLRHQRARRIVLLPAIWRRGFHLAHGKGWQTEQRLLGTSSQYRIG